MSMAIEVKGITKRYGGLTAVNQVSFAIEEGEIFGLLGPNGAGKTTTLEMIEGLRKPDSGSIQICNLDVALKPDKVKEIIGVQLQSTSLYDRIKVGVGNRPFRKLAIRVSLGYSRCPAKSVLE